MRYLWKVYLIKYILSGVWKDCKSHQNLKILVNWVKVIFSLSPLPPFFFSYQGVGVGPHLLCSGLISDSVLLLRDHSWQYSWTICSSEDWTKLAMCKTDALIPLLILSLNPKEFLKDYILFSLVVGGGEDEAFQADPMNPAASSWPTGSAVYKRTWGGAER